MRNYFDIIKGPVVSEKSTYLIEETSQKGSSAGTCYSFKVRLTATKDEVRDAVEHLFNVKVSRVRTMINHGKVARVGQNVSKRNNWKKAIVQLKKGQKIELFQVSK